MKRRNLENEDFVELEITKEDVSYTRPERDKEITLWNLINDYVEEKWPKIRRNHWVDVNNIGVFDTYVIVDKRKYDAADPEFFKHIDKACRKNYTLCKGSGRRSLTAKWSIEAVNDLQAVHGIDAEAELIENLKRSLQRE